MAQSIFLFLAAFLATLAIAAGPYSSETHVEDAYPAIAFFAGVVVAVLGFLLKFFMTRDREAIDRQFSSLQADHSRDVALLHKHMEHMEAKTKGYVDGLGVKVERIAETIDEQINHAVEELQRHDRELFQKWDALNREFGQLKGEHETLKDAHHRRHNGP